MTADTPDTEQDNTIQDSGDTKTSDSPRGDAVAAGAVPTGSDDADSAPAVPKKKKKKKKDAAAPAPQASAVQPDPIAAQSARQQFLEHVDPRKHRVVSVVALLCVAALVATVVLAVLFDRRSDELAELKALEKNSASAERIAGDYAVGAATFGFEDLTPWAAALKKGTAPELNSRFDVAVTTLTPLIQEVQWSQTAELIAAKTVDIRADRQFVVQVFVSTQMTSTQNPAGLNTITPYTITLDRDDNWLITDVAGIAGTAQDGSTGDGTPGLVPTTPAPPTEPSVPPTP